MTTSKLIDFVTSVMLSAGIVGGASVLAQTPVAQPQEMRPVGPAAPSAPAKPIVALKVQVTLSSVRRREEDVEPAVHALGQRERSEFDELERRHAGADAGWRHRNGCPELSVPQRRNEHDLQCHDARGRPVSSPSHH